MLTTYNSSPTALYETLTSQLLNHDELVVLGTSLKNFYDQKFDMNYDRDENLLLGLKFYKKLGQTQEAPWLSYNYTTSGELSGNTLQNYQFIERIKGLHKLNPTLKHKSNLYSIKIKNSGLNNAFTASDSLKQDIQTFIKAYIKDTLRNNTPVHTQLLSIDFTGR
jgi:hypothetical protein